jgi:hypothetical protein
VHNRGFGDAEMSCSLRYRQHTAVAKPVVARAQRVSMDEVGDVLRCEASVAAPRSGRSAGMKLLLIENVGDFGIDLVVEEFVDELDDLGRGLDLLAS